MLHVKKQDCRKMKLHVVQMKKYTVQPTIKTTSEALQLLEQTQYFLDFFGHGSVANDVGVVIYKVATLQMKQLMNVK